MDDPLFECLQDPDYDDLHKIIDQGLPPTKTPHSVGIVGGGIAGLTAAKVLEDAGHKVLLYIKLYIRFIVIPYNMVLHLTQCSNRNIQ